MSKPTIYFQSLNSGAFPSKQESFRWTEETELGTKLTGDDTAASVGIHLGALTNLSSSNEFGVIISHSATNPITGVKFYFQPTTNVRTNGTGFTSSADAAGAQTDFDELLKWGDDADTTEGMTIKQWHEADYTLLKTGVADELANAIPLSNYGKFKDTIDNEGDSDDGEKDWIEPFADYVSNDAAGVKLQLNVPDIEDAGIRQMALYTRIVYTF